MCPTDGAQGSANSFSWLVSRGNATVIDAIAAYLERQQNEIPGNDDLGGMHLGRLRSVEKTTLRKSVLTRLAAGSASFNDIEPYSRRVYIDKMQLSDNTGLAGASAMNTPIKKSRCPVSAFQSAVDLAAEGCRPTRRYKENDALSTNVNRYVKGCVLPFPADGKRCLKMPRPLSKKFRSAKVN